MNKPTDEAALESQVQCFKALADGARLKILEYLAQNPADTCCSPEDAVCACDLESVTGLSQPTVSHHMKILTAAGLVSGEKRGRWMYYRLESSGFDEVSKLIGRYVQLSGAQ